MRDQITTAEAARILGVTSRHVTLLIRSGKLRGQKLGRDWILSRKSVEQFERTPRGRAPKNLAS